VKKILITGANGYIGKCLYHSLKGKFKVIGIDKESTSMANVYRCNILNSKKLEQILHKTKPEIVVHLAAQSLVDETINKDKYYNNNVVATNALLKSMKKNNIKNIIFSSTAAVYQQSSKPLKESAKLKPLSTYAKTKLICEKNINKQKNINSIILRFFNVCSSLTKPCLGELHNPETHLIPTIVYKAIYNKKIYIYGNDFPTPDGTCIRDYIHIKDICSAIQKSIKLLLFKKKSKILNIGNRKGLSNQQIVNYINKRMKKKINLEYVKRRRGDLPRLVCNSDKAKGSLNWIARNSNINKIVLDEINWIKKLKKLGINRKFKNYL